MKEVPKVVENMLPVSSQLPLKPCHLKTLVLTLVFLAVAPFVLASSASSAITPDPNVIRVSADQQNYNVEQQKYELKGNVSVAFQDIKVSGSRAILDVDSNGKPAVARFYNRPNFKRMKPKMGEDNIVGDQISLYLNDDRFGAEGHVESFLATVAANPLTIRSDVQQFDNKNKVVAASGGVQINYQGSQAFGSLANVRMGDDGKAERLIMQGGARLKQEASEISGDKITVMVNSGDLIAEHGVQTRVDLKSQSKSSDPMKVLISSDYQQYDKTSDTMLASGHVKVIYGDYYVVGPKASFKLRNGELDRILITGRGTITENGRTITADRIVITTNPKNFDAVGNVKVNFRQASTAASSKPATSSAPAVRGKTAPSSAVAGKGQKALPKDDPLDY